MRSTGQMTGVHSACRAAAASGALPAGQRPTDYDNATDYGVTVETSENASCIFLEVIRDVGHPARGNPGDWVDLAHVIAHEIGHAGGGQHGDLGLMSAVPAIIFNDFTAATLKRFRENARW
jgi:hypothetical protein